MIDKILLIDIETTPILAYVWGIWDQHISLSQIVKPTEMMCFGAKWQGKKAVTFRSVHHHGKEEMLEELHRLMEEADAIVGWNTAAFDHKHINREFIENGMLPPSTPVQDLDLMTVTKSNFKFPSNKLDYVSNALGLGSKFKHQGFEMWIKCMAGDEKAWREMKKYQIRDVVMLEGVYQKLLPWFAGSSSVSIRDKRGISSPDKDDTIVL
jgi:uncharacterized protein YprB with RNaseH-like and TPR domain